MAQECAVVVGMFTWPSLVLCALRLLPATCLVVKQVGTDRRQLTGQRARLAAETGVVLVGAVTSLDDQPAVGEERVVRAVRVQVNT